MYISDELIHSVLAVSSNKNGSICSSSLLCLIILLLLLLLLLLQGTNATKRDALPLAIHVPYCYVENMLVAGNMSVK